MVRDEVFKNAINKQFEFDESVASVFDDMVSRSVPFYKQTQELIISFLTKRLEQGARVVDLGCSTATTLLELYRVRPDLTLIGVDSSQAMLEQAKNRSIGYGAKLELVEADILEYDYGVADVVLLNYTLQFIRPMKRDEFVRKIYASLSGGGLFIFSEKLIYNDKRFGLEMINIYEEYKEMQGYSKFEIAQKRQALENVLIPYSETENKQLCVEAGFSSVETVFKWANFASFVAFK